MYNYVGCFSSGGWDMDSIRFNHVKVEKHDHGRFRELTSCQSGIKLAQYKHCSKLFVGYLWH